SLFLFPTTFPIFSSPNPPKSAGVGGCYKGSGANKVALSEAATGGQKVEPKPLSDLKHLFYQFKRSINLAVHHPSQPEDSSCLCKLNPSSWACPYGLIVKAKTVTSTFRPARCCSAQCNLAGSTACVTTTNTCGLFPENTITRTSTYGDLGSDVVSIQSTNGKNPGRVVSKIQGMAGLGRSRISLPSQFSASFSFPRKFVVCLTSERNASGAVFFGDGPYVLLPDVDASNLLAYTPLFIKPEVGGVASSDYFIRVKPVKVNKKIIPINAKLLSTPADFGGFGEEEDGKSGGKRERERPDRSHSKKLAPNQPKFLEGI
ncbi:hypothetical protein RJ639_014645, partial [Escallonia herrerae]